MAEQVERRFDRDRVARDLQQVVGGGELGVDLARALEVALVRRPHLLGDLRADDVGVDADAAEPAELEEGAEDVVVARVEVEALGDDVPRLVEVVVRLLDRR